ncbi:hypothetical protein [Winogradskyella sp.]|uniref:hypothetical protein n=1 Tax=Winogradskyella sp. TaxID=1883156 RepID=UPI0025F5C769|nr:hypothetical protein [Winogradskyella sp.]
MSQKFIALLVIGVLSYASLAPMMNAQTRRQTVDHRKEKQYTVLEHYWSNDRKDNLTTASEKGKKAAKAAKYRFVRQDGYVLSKASNVEGKSVPLYLYYNKTRRDYFTTATTVGIKSANSAGYVKIGLEGYVLQTVNSKFKHLYKPLWLYYNNSRKDNFTIATSKGMKAAEAAGYRKVRIEGYIRINNKKSTNSSITKISDPFTRLKKEAQKTVLKKSKMESVKITTNNPNWKTRSRTEIEFVPFKLEDDNGKPISPNEKITLKTGKIITAQELIDKTNDLERKLNKQGYSLRNNSKKIISTTVTGKQFLDDRKALAPKSIGAFKNEPQVKNFMSLEKKVKVGGRSPRGRRKTITLKPYSMYSEREKKLVNTYNFLNTSGNVLAQKTTKLRNYKDFKLKKLGNLSKLYKVDITNKRDWGFGNPSTFQAKIEGSINRFAIIYPFDSKNPDRNKSEFKVTAKGKAKGALFGNEMDILNASCMFYAPSNISKNMVASVSVKAMETTLFSLNKSYPQRKSFSKTHGKTFDKSFEIEIPIIAGIDFKGLIGVKGEVGFEYEAKIERTVASVHAKPIVDLKGYAEAGVEFLDLLGGGVGGKLTFIKGEFDLNAHTGIWSQNSEEIVLGIKYYFGYDVEMLSGEMYAYLEACIKYIGCYRPVEHQFFKWDGFKDSGTIVEGDILIPLANIARYDEQPVLSQN